MRNAEDQVYRLEQEVWGLERQVEQIQNEVDELRSQLHLASLELADERRDRERAEAHLQEYQVLVHDYRVECEELRARLSKYEGNGHE